MAAPVITPYPQNVGSQFIGCPAVYQITPTGSGVGKTFYRMKVKVVVGMTGGYEDVDFKFSKPIEVKTVNGTPSAQNTYFDVSSALQAIVDQWQPTADPQTFTYPTISFYIEAQEEWMGEGVVSHSDTARYPGSTGTVTMYMGKLTDRERLAASPQPPATYSRKPTTSPEICYYRPTAQGASDGTSKHLLPGICNDNGDQAAPSVTAVTVPADLQTALADSSLSAESAPSDSSPSAEPAPSDSSPSATVPVASASGVNIFGIPYPPYGHEIRFINSLGVHENVFVSGLPTKDVNITTEKYAIARQETLTQFSRGLAVKTDDHETWTFSSGALDEAWASWYIHEFLMSRWAWIDINGAWIPCHLLPEETITLVDHEKANPIEVQFKLQLDINGSPIL